MTVYGDVVARVNTQIIDKNLKGVPKKLVRKIDSVCIGGNEKSGMKRNKVSL